MRKHKSCKETPGVAHIDSCGMGIVNQKPQKPSRQAGAKNHNRRRTADQPQTRQTDSGYGAGARGQTVHHIEYIERIAHPDQPDAGQYGVDDRTARCVESKSAPDRNNDREDLKTKLLKGRKRPFIVDESDGAHSKGADPQANRKRQRRKGKQQQGGDRDGHAADRRNRLRTVSAAGMQPRGAQSGGTEKRRQQQSASETECEEESG